jgi:hypothetical protein
VRLGEEEGNTVWRPERVKMVALGIFLIIKIKGLLSSDD